MVDVQVRVQDVTDVAETQAMFLQLVLDHGFVALEATQAHRFHDLVRTVAGIDQDRPGAAKYQHAEHQHAALATAIAPEHQEARFNFNVPVIQNLSRISNAIGSSPLTSVASFFLSLKQRTYIGYRDADVVP